MLQPNSKLELSGDRTRVASSVTAATLSSIFAALGCPQKYATLIAEHLTDTSLCGMESHGVMRTLQYAEQFASGVMRADASITVRTNSLGGDEVDGGGGSGIPAMHIAYEQVMQRAADNGIAMLAVRNVGHTGRHGAFADDAAQAGFLTIAVGGGNRKNWRQVAPYGGARAMLPTNPYCIGIPGGERGSVVLDFATSKIAGGWLYAARSAGALLPPDSIIDRNGNPTRDPEDYFDGGAILPAGAQKGYGLALMGELIAEAMLGRVKAEGNWLLIALNPRRYSESGAMRQTAEDILSEMRHCPPAPGFERVEIPGEREREHRVASGGVIAIPKRTWQQISQLAFDLGVGGTS